MFRSSKFTLSMIIIVFAASISFAMYEIDDTGTWPDTWPNELESLRKQSRTLSHSNFGHIYEITFTRRDQFELAWPHILKVKSKEAPIILIESPDKFRNFGASMKAGVRILAPMTGAFEPPQNASYPLTPEVASKMLKIGPPWPDDIKSKSGALPEYVVAKDGQWAAYTNEMPAELRMRRARTEIQLIVDGDIVDLNRIPLPPDTPIIDRRFKTVNNQSGASD
jgi:hypothetical protein